MCVFSILANRDGNTVLFHHEGGVDVGDVDSKAARLDVDIESELSAEQARELVKEVGGDKQDVLVDFLQLLYRAYSDLYFTLLEINPLGECLLKVCFELTAPWAAVEFVFFLEHQESIHPGIDYRKSILVGIILAE